MDGAADVESLPSLIGFVLESARHVAVPEAQLGKLELVLEEILLNIIRHGYSPDQQGRISVSCGPAAPGEVRVDIRDWGCPFDPLQADPPDLTLSLSQRQIGGLGIFLTLELTDRRAYTRVDGHNVFSFCFPRRASTCV